MSETREAKVKLTADPRDLERGLKRSKAALSDFEKAAGKAITGGVGRAVGMLKTAAAGLAIGAGAMFANEGVKALKFEESLTRLKIATGSTSGEMRSLRGDIRTISDTTGVAREDLLGATSAFVALTGDVNTARGSMELFAKVNKGSGASLDDVATAAASLRQNLRIESGDLEKAFSIISRGGKSGAIEIKEVAGLLSSLAPLGAQFAGGLGTQGLGELTSGLQLVRQGFGSASEAATGLQRLLGAIVRGSGKLKAGGVDVFTVDKQGNKRLKNFQEIVEAIGNSKLAKSPKLLIDALGSNEALRAYMELTKVKGAWSGLTAEAMRANDVAEDYAEFQKSSSGEIEAQWNRLKNTVAETFTPERIKLFAQVLGNAVELAAGLMQSMQWFGEWIDERSGGPKSTASKMDSANRVDDAIKAGFTLEQLAAGSPGEGASFATRERWSKIVTPGTYKPDDIKSASIEAKSRLEKDRKAKAENALAATLRDAEAGRTGLDPIRQRSTAPRAAPSFLGDVKSKQVSVRVDLSPFTEKVGATVSNSKAQRVRP